MLFVFHPTKRIIQASLKSSNHTEPKIEREILIKLIRANNRNSIENNCVR